MITLKEWEKLSEKEQVNLTREPFSYRQCQKCLNHIDLGGNNEENAEGMYLDSYPFDCSEENIIDYEKKNNFNLTDNVFCWDCIKKITNDLEREAA